MPGAASPERSGPRRYLNLVLVRHGETAWNAEGRLQGQTDIPLSETGRVQARALGRRLRSLWANPSQRPFARPRAIYTSDLSRARETAELIRGDSIDGEIPVHSTALVRERGFGEWEGLTPDESRAKFGGSRHHGEEGEPHEAVWARMTQALTEIWDAEAAVDPRTTAVLVGHGGSLRQLVCIVTGLGIDSRRHFSLSNTGLSLIQIHGQALESASTRIALWNDTSHLDHNVPS